jgi:hypothetical protein
VTNRGFRRIVGGVTLTARRALLAACVIALVAVGVASAANSASYSDPSGDVLLAPDLKAFSVSNTDAGVITVTITFGAVATGGIGFDEVGFAIDSDQNPDTGSVLYGTEVAIYFDASRLYFSRANGAYFRDAPNPPSLAATLANNSATFTFSAADVGLTPASGFNIVVDSYDLILGETDTAPDIRTANYQLVAGTPSVVAGADTRAPLDKAYKSSGVHGKLARLWYASADGRGQTTDTIKIYRGKRVLRTIVYRLSDTNPYFDYYAKWNVPKKVRGKLRFCVSSSDAAGNKSNVSCAPLTIK